MKLNHKWIGMLTQALVDGKDDKVEDLRMVMNLNEIEAAEQMADEILAEKVTPNVEKQNLLDELQDIVRELRDLEFDLAEEYEGEGAHESKFTSDFTIAVHALDEIEMELRDDIIGEGE